MIAANTTSLLADVRQVAIIDDDDAQAEALGELMIDFGFAPRLFSPGVAADLYDDIDHLLAAVVDGAQAAVCDHRLRPSSRASFPGSQAVARLYQRRIPAVLITRYHDIDDDTSIRLWRPWIPVVLSREETSDNPERIVEGLRVCQEELMGRLQPNRRTQRCVLRVDEIAEEDNTPVIDVFISGWAPDTAVRLPLEVIPEDLRAQVVRGAFLLADVNTGAERKSDLYFDQVRLAGPPVDGEPLPLDWRRSGSNR